MADNGRVPDGDRCRSLFYLRGRLAESGVRLGNSELMIIDLQYVDARGGMFAHCTTADRSSEES
jgi:hypothetical protein